MPKRVTISDVAREAGVSMMTVSRVLNDKADVAAETRLRVLEVIRQLGYRPSRLARSLVTKRTNTLGLVVPDNANPFFSDLARGVERSADESGYIVYLCNTDEDPKRETAILRSLEERRVDGVVLCSSRLEDEELAAALQGYGAVVLVNRQLSAESVSAVWVDDELAGRLAAQHLLLSGHRRIAFLAGPLASRSGRLRRKGFQSELSAAGVSCPPEWMPHGAPTVEGGTTAAYQVLTCQPAPTALFCFNDLVAVGALLACTELGLGVPHDVAVVGADDIPLAALVTPALTTVRVPRYELGSQAVRLLLEQVAGQAGGGQEVVLKPELVVRDSTLATAVHPLAQGALWPAGSSD